MYFLVSQQMGYCHKKQTAWFCVKGTVAVTDLSRWQGGGECGGILQSERLALGRESNMYSPKQKAECWFKSGSFHGHRFQYNQCGQTAASRCENPPTFQGLQMGTVSPWNVGELSHSDEALCPRFYRHCWLFDADICVSLLNWIPAR
jgi:hypothetical protein